MLMVDSRYPLRAVPNGMVAASHYLAAEVGVDVLENGGTAVDAAVAAAAVLCVVYPHCTGIGGDLLAIVWPDQSERPIGLDASGGVPTSALTELSAGERPAHSLVSVSNLRPYIPAAPGVVAGWVALLDRFGTRSLYDLLIPAEEYAQHGVPVAAHLAWAIQQYSGTLNVPARELFLPKSTPLHNGQIMRNPDLATTLRSIGDTSGRAIYEGGLAEVITAAVHEYGGWLSQLDLTVHTSEWIMPMTGEWFDYTIYTLPPIDHEMTVSGVLQQLFKQDVNPTTYDSIDFIDCLLQDIYQKAPAANQFPADAELGAACVCAVDHRGMAVSLLQSIGSFFGSGIMVPGTGILLHNRGVYSTNTMKQRPPRVSAPVLIGYAGHPALILGTTGDTWYPAVASQILLNRLAFDMNAQQAIEAPRFRYELGAAPALHKDRIVKEPRLMFEERFTPEVWLQLQQRGHEIRLGAAWSPEVGHAQMIELDWVRGVVWGAADPRADGLAIGY
jgi:gamma-glutamyltranspeptidase/glutathione hydrolase